MHRSVRNQALSGAISGNEFRGIHSRANSKANTKQSQNPMHFNLALLGIPRAAALRLILYSYLAN